MCAVAPAHVSSASGRCSSLPWQPLSTLAHRHSSSARGQLFTATSIVGGIRWVQHEAPSRPDRPRVSGVLCSYVLLCGCWSRCGAAACDLRCLERCFSLSCLKAGPHPEGHAPAEFVLWTGTCQRGVDRTRVNCSVPQPRCPICARPRPRARATEPG